MLRILIVDDEPDIADSLYILLQERLPFESEIYKAYSGKSALEWAKRGKFDMVLTDIRMPVISGLELQKQIHALWPRCKVIFLTGHSEFEYVYEAIKHRNTSYLLKTEGHELILETAVRAARLILEEQKLEGLITQTLLQMEQTVPLMKNELLLDLLQGEELSAHERAEQFRELRVGLSPYNKLLIMRAKLPHSDEVKISKARLHAGMKVICEQFGYDWLQISYVFVTRRTIAVFFQPKMSSAEVAEDKVKMAAQAFAENAALAFRDNFGLTLMCICDCTACRWEELADRWALLQSGARRLDEQSGLVDAGSAETPHEFERIRLLRKTDRLSECLTGGGAAPFNSEWARLWEEEAASDAAAASTARLGHALSLAFLRATFSMNLQDKLQLLADLKPMLHPSEAGLDRAGLRRYYRQLADHIFALQQHEQSERRDRTIETIKQYIHSHLAEDLSLVRLSEVAGLNPSYLSRAFKKGTGQNVLSYIHEIKLQAAKQMLGQTAVKIQDISTSLGFISPPHFTRFFKKASGVAPQDYRNQLIHGSHT